MKKLLALLLVLLLLTGCSTDSTEESTVTTISPTEAVTEAATVPETESTTEEPTEAPTEAATEAPTEVAAEEPTEAPVEPPVTEPPATEHKHSYTSSVTAPTCTEKGYTTYTCSCGDSYNASGTDAAGHSMVETEKVDYTCDTDGYTTYICTACGFSYTEEIPAAHDYDIYIIYSCIFGDRTEYTCKVCGDYYYENGDPRGHDYSDFQYTVPPTCEQEGYDYYKCANPECEHGDHRNFVPATGHSMVETERVDYTCDTPGYYTMTCSVCGHSETTEIPIHSNYVMVYNPDYENDGHRYNKVWSCQYCEYLVVEKGELQPHNYKVVFDCPCGPIGYTDYECADCGYTNREHYDPIYAEHNYVEVEGLEPGYRTCTQCGLTAYSGNWE